MGAVFEKGSEGVRVVETQEDSTFASQRNRFQWGAHRRKVVKRRALQEEENRRLEARRVDLRNPADRQIAEELRGS
jgi:hypothetical protein